MLLSLNFYKKNWLFLKVHVIISLMISSEVELFGRKTFFIAPDTSLIPKNYLEEFMLRGYQAYVINDDYVCPMQVKVHEIIRLYPDSILYFNIDSTIDGIDWKTYISELQQFVGQNILIGIFYLSRQNSQDEENIKKLYVDNIHVAAGCFALSAHNHNNFDSILRVLEKTGARGRRNLVRAFCDSSSTIKFERNGHSCRANLLDINISYFRCDLQADTEKIEIFDKVRDVNISVNGTSFVSDAVLIMKRTLNDKTLCIFMFIKRDDTPDLAKDEEKRLNQKIYQIVLNENTEKLQTAFRAAEK